MPSTHKTGILLLDQYDGTDKFTRADYNNTMLNLENIITGLLPLGMVVPSSAPATHDSRWVPVHGQLLAREDYPDLWAAVSGSAVSDATWLSDPLLQGTYSDGDGSTTFRVPDYRGRALFGEKTDDVDFTFGNNIGSKTHQHPLSTAGHAQIAIQNVSTDNILVKRVTIENFESTHKLTGSSPGASGGASVGFGAALGGSTDPSTGERDDPTYGGLPPGAVIKWYILASYLPVA